MDHILKHINSQKIKLIQKIWEKEKRKTALLEEEKKERRTMEQERNILHIYA